MGKKEKALKRVVLDTNVLVSALLFRGELSEIVTLWKTGKIAPVISRDTFCEFRAVLGYPRFRLTGNEIKVIIEEEVLPCFEVVEVDKDVQGVCFDPDDDKFLACAVAAGAAFIVSGDRALCNVGKFKTVRIVTAAEFLRKHRSPKHRG